MEANALRSAPAARALGVAARARGLVVPGFRSPPRLAGAERTMRRWPGGRVSVAVALRERPFAAVVADMVEGVIVANRLDGTEATRVRTALWSAVVADPDLADQAA
jgi:hypothetical protein